MHLAHPCEAGSCAGHVGLFVPKNGAGHIEGHVAAADNDHALSEQHGFTQSDVPQELDSAIHVLRFNARDVELARLLRAHSNNHGGVAVYNLVQCDASAYLRARENPNTQRLDHRYFRQNDIPR